MHKSKSIARHSRSLWIGAVLILCFLVAGFAAITGLRFDAPPKLRVACVGDSTTWGTYATRAEGATYPDCLAKLGRKTLEVRNCGVGATTLLRRSGHAWCDTGELERTIEFQPDIVIIMFGVNEIAHPDLLDEFLSDALWLVSQFKSAIPDVGIFIATPTPFAPGEEKLRENTELHTKIIPVLRQVAEMAGCDTIEINHDYPPTLEYLPDGLHPNAMGNRLVAQLVFDAIGEKVRPSKSPCP